MKKQNILMFRMLLMVIMFMPLVSSATDFLNLSQDDANQARSDMRGNLITPIVNNLTITATTYTLATPTVAQLWMKTGLGTGVSLENVSITSGNATFTTQMNTSTRYYITAYDNGNAYQARANGSATGSYPRLNTQLNTSASVAMSAGEYVDQTEVWKYFFTSNASASPPVLYPNHTMFFPNTTSTTTNSNRQGIVINISANNISSYIVMRNPNMSVIQDVNHFSDTLGVFLYEFNETNSRFLRAFPFSNSTTGNNGNATINYNFNKSRSYAFILGRINFGIGNWDYIIAKNASSQIPFYANNGINVSNNSHYKAYQSASASLNNDASEFNNSLNVSLYEDEISNVFQIWSSNQTYLNSTAVYPLNLATLNNVSNITFSGIGFSSRVYNNALNVTMYSNISGAWIATRVNSTGYSAGDTNFSINLNAGTYMFGYRVEDASNVTWSDNNTFTVQSVSPILISNIPNFTLAHFQTNQSNMGSYFQNFDQFIVTYVDPDTNLTSNVSSVTVGGNRIINTYFSMRVAYVTEALNHWNISSFGKNLINSPMKAYACNSNISICEVSNTFYLTINQSSATAPYSNVGALSNWVGGIFPDKDTLSLTVRFGVVFAVLIVLSIFILIGGYTIGMAGSFIVVTMGIIDFLILMLFVSIGYVPFAVILLLLLAFIGILYLNIRK